MANDIAPDRPSDARQEWFGHPVQLKRLVVTEMWERFGYYGMRAILLLFMIAPLAMGGMGMDQKEAAQIYGNYTMASYMVCILGGYLADNFIGARRAVLIGGLIITAGHFCLAFASVPTFYTGLILVALGTGLLKPSISTLVGGLYSHGDTRRDAGFSLFYMGINLGAFAAQLDVEPRTGREIDIGLAAHGLDLALDQQRHALLKAQAIHAGAAELIVQPCGHAVEFQFAQLFQGGVHHHGFVLSCLDAAQGHHW